MASKLKVDELAGLDGNTISIGIWSNTRYNKWYVNVSNTSVTNAKIHQSQ